MASGKRPNQISVSVTPQIRAELERLRADGKIYSIQEFIRQAISHELERQRAAAPVPSEGALKTMRRARSR